jgi:hypothetical protein
VAVPQQVFLWQLWHFSLKQLPLLPQPLPQVPQIQVGMPHTAICSRIEVFERNSSDICSTSGKKKAGLRSLMPCRKIAAIAVRIIAVFATFQLLRCRHGHGQSEIEYRVTSTA